MKPESIGTTSLPTKHQRQIAKEKMLEAVSSWLRVRIDEVFEMADKDREPEFGERITWRDLLEIREQICGCIADDLHDGLGECVQEILEAELSSKPEVGGITPLREPVAEPAALLRLTTQLYWTVTRDVACAINSGQYFEATSPEEAQAKAVAFSNKENGYGPEEDGGFEPILVYDQADLKWILSGLEAFGKHATSAEHSRRTDEPAKTKANQKAEQNEDTKS